MIQIWYLRPFNLLLIAHQPAMISPKSILGTISPPILLPWFKLDGYSFCSHPNSTKVVASKLCTCHNSTAVVACAKFWSNMMTTNGITIKWILHGIWITSQRWLWDGPLTVKCPQWLWDFHDISWHEEFKLIWKIMLSFKWKLECLGVVIWCGCAALNGGCLTTELLTKCINLNNPLTPLNASWICREGTWAWSSQC